MQISELYQLFLRYPQVTTDSRHCPAGSIFFALKGERFDGNQYAAKALEAGCAVAVIDNPTYYINEQTVLVDDVLKTLQQLACYHRQQLGIPVIGITGTNGKTTTKELLAAVLSTQYNLLYTQGNLNNQIGVPLTLLRLTKEHELAVIEMGASHPGDIQELVEIALPNYGLITNVGRAHLEGFGSFEGVIRTKGELYDYIRKTNGKIFIKEEDNDLQQIAGGIEQIPYSRATATLQINDTPFLSFDWLHEGEIRRIDTHLIGAYNIDNVLAALTVGNYFGIPVDTLCQAIAAYEPTNNRSQLKKTTNNTLLIDTYNANPSSMKVALDNFLALQVAPKAVILGDMRELGATSDALHTEVVTFLRNAQFDKVYLCGEHFSRTGSKTFETFATTAELLTALEAQPLVGYHILIKGSHGMALEKTIPYL